jgi:predicted ArsR family transcriptional regulator
MNTPPTHTGRRIVKINALTQAHLIKLLLDGDRTCQELAEETGLHYVTVLQYTRELHRAGAAHITRYDKDVRGRDMIKVYKLGKGKDAKREKKTACERQTQYRSRRRMATLLNVFPLAA